MDATAEVVDQIKNIGFHYATQSGITIAVSDIKVPDEKPALLAEADGAVDEIDEQYQMGLITEQERYDATVNVWNETTDERQQAHPAAPRPDYGSRLHDGDLRREG